MSSLLKRCPFPSRAGARRAACFSALLASSVVPMSSSDAAETVLTTDAADHVNPQWSPDGNWIVYEKVIGGKSQIYKVPAAGGAEVAVVENSLHTHVAPRWSPVKGLDDHYWIAYSSDDDSEAALRIFVARDDGQIVRQRTSDPDLPSGLGHVEPRWSGDASGKRITFTRGDDGVSSIFVTPSGINMSAGAAAELPRDISLLVPHHGDVSAAAPYFCGLSLMTVVAGASAHRAVWTPVSSGPGANHLVLEREIPSGNPNVPNRFKIQRYELARGTECPTFDVYASGDSREAEWKPNGLKIALRSVFDGESDSEIVTASADGVTIKRLTTNEDDEDQLTWSHNVDCGWVAFRRRLSASEHQIWAAHEDPAVGLVRVSEGSSDHARPTWNPASFEEIAYQKLIDGKWQIVKKYVDCPL